MNPESLDVLFKIYLYLGLVIAFIFLIYKGVKQKDFRIDEMILHTLISLVMAIIYPLVIFLLPIYIGKAIKFVFEQRALRKSPEYRKSKLKAFW